MPVGTTAKILTDRSDFVSNRKPLLLEKGRGQVSETDSPIKSERGHLKQLDKSKFTNKYLNMEKKSNRSKALEGSVEKTKHMELSFQKESLQLDEVSLVKDTERNSSALPPAESEKKEETDQKISPPKTGQKDRRRKNARKESKYETAKNAKPALESSVADIEPVAPRFPMDYMKYIELYREQLLESEIAELQEGKFEKVYFGGLVVNRN